MLLFLTSFLPLLGTLPSDTSAHILYHIHHGDTHAGFSRYLETIGDKEHDYALLQQAGINLLMQGSCEKETETQLMCLLGAGVSLCPPLLPILEKAIQSKEIQPQLVSLNFLSMLEDDGADKLLFEALSSPYLLVRLEACFQLSKKNHPAVLEHLQSLIVKVPPAIHPLFPQIVINLDSNSANQMMRQLLSDSDLATRCESIMAVARAKRDDFLPQIRTLATQTQVVQQECAATALGELRDRASINTLRSLATSKQKSVRLAASYALYQLGEKKAVELILNEGEDLLAIALLGQIQTDEASNQLTKYAREGTRDIKLNAIIALLQQRDKRALPYLEELLLSEKKDIGYIHASSPGGGIKIWKTVSSASHKQKIYPSISQDTLQLRSSIIMMALELDEESFLNLATTITEEKLKQLIPLTLELLSNHRSKESIALLKQQQQQASSDFVRTYCDLALYKLGEEGPYESNLIKWVDQRKHTLMIRFKQEPSSERRTKHLLTPEEESRLLIDCYEALAAAQNRQGIETLIHAIAEGNKQNRYALAGLLIRTTE
ncbi:MAG: hypothetical protein S4CHLAM45_09300 [Chlamydiales bacterium]|nr:hypothetical protein [Chlamydiales bacterium]MCH9620081.1 hypothetical protein [Chlamydiales bacterium]MCH9623034.1 hypothetical protein [Chlamydiales bacterium]